MEGKSTDTSRSDTEAVSPEKSHSESSSTKTAICAAPASPADKTDWDNVSLSVVVNSPVESLTDQSPVTSSSDPNQNLFETEILPVKIQESDEGENSVHTARLTVDISCCYSSKEKGVLLDVSIKKLKHLLAGKERYSDGSGYAASCSKSSSSNGTFLPTNLINPPPSILNRISFVSSSSGSSGSSAAAVIRSCMKTEPLSKERIKELEKKWMNSSMIYNLLDCIDKYFDNEEEVKVKPEESETKTVSTPAYKEKKLSQSRSSKRKPQSEISEPDTKKPKKQVLSESPNSVIRKTVFAKWSDHKYYAGQIIDKIDADRCTVQFYDGKTRNISRKLTVNNSLELLFGKNVMVCSPLKDKCYPGLIIDSKATKDQLMYVAVTNEGDFEVPISHIFFTEAQMRQVRKDLKESSPTKTDDLKILTDDRSPPKCMRVTRSQARLYNPKPGSSGAKVNSNVKPNSSSSSSTSIVTSSSSDESLIIGCEPEIFFQTPSPESKVKLKNIRGKVPKTSNKHDDSVVGPIVAGTWFHGYSFILTCSSTCGWNCQNNEDSSTDNENYRFTEVPFVYDRLELQIKLGGGQIYTSVKSVRNFQMANVFLIAPKPCLTGKYIEALAAGVKILCHEWVVNCCKKRKKLPFQELPIGWSFEAERFINSYERSLLPFDNIYIEIAHGDDDNFFDFWSDVCVIAGAKVMKYNSCNVNKEIILVRDGVFEESFYKDYTQGAGLVNTFWVVQSLIHGEARDPAFHSIYMPQEDSDAGN